MADQFLSEIRAVGFNFAPVGWATTDGQIIRISQNTALFALLGTAFGGDGMTTYALPDLRGRLPMHSGQGPGLSPRAIGTTGGVEFVAQQAIPLPGSPAPSKQASAGFAPKVPTLSPFCVVNFIIALEGIFPARS
jgi:microcystin-dependent protein